MIFLALYFLGVVIAYGLIFAISQKIDPAKADQTYRRDMSYSFIMSWGSWLIILIIFYFRGFEHKMKFW